MRIGLIGLSGVGKTTYISIIIGRLLNPWRVRVVEPMREEILESINFSFDKGTETYWARGVAEIVDKLINGQPVIGTEISEGLKDLRVTMTVDSPRGPLSADVSFGDFSGEVFATIVQPVLEKMMEGEPPRSFKDAFIAKLNETFGGVSDPVVKKGYEIVLNFVKNTYDGLIIMMDPINIKNVDQVRLFYLLKAVGESVGRRRIPVVILFSKSITYGLVKLPRGIEEQDPASIRELYLGLVDLATKRFKGLCNLLYGKLRFSGEYKFISAFFYDAYLYANGDAPKVMFDDAQKVHYFISFAPYTPLVSLLYQLHGIDPKAVLGV